MTGVRGHMYYYTTYLPAVVLAAGAAVLSPAASFHAAVAAASAQPWKLTAPWSGRPAPDAACAAATPGWMEITVASMLS